MNTLKPGKTPKTPDPAKCYYPHCKKKAMKWLDLPIIQEHEGNRRVKTDQYKRCHFCNYHFFIAGSGLFAVMPKTADHGKFYIVGPFENVLIAESVVGAREMMLREYEEKKSKEAKQ